MAITVWNGHILVIDGDIATGADCCPHYQYKEIEPLEVQSATAYRVKEASYSGITYNTKVFGQDPGSGAFLIDGNAYVLDSTVQVTSKPADNVNETVYYDIAGFTYNNGTKTEYSRGERAIANYEMGSRQQGISITSTSSAPGGSRALQKFFTVSASAPTVNDDTTADWVVDARWFHSTTGKIYRSTSVAAGAAVWVNDNSVGTLFPSTTGGLVRGWKGAASDNGTFYKNGVSLGRYNTYNNEANSFAQTAVNGDVFQARQSLSAGLVVVSFLPDSHG